MFFERHQRYVYARPQLQEVICQLRFPTILTINEKAPAQFQETVREDFPLYSVRREQPAPRLAGAGTPGQHVEQGEPVANYSFVSSTGIWKLNLTQGFVALSTLRYNGWEDFAQRLDRPLAEFIRIYSPAFFERIGLRYVNIVSRKALGLEGTPWRELFRPAYLGPLAEEDVDESAVVKCATDTEMNFSDGVHLKLHAGPGLLRRGNQPDPEVKFIVDIDCSATGQMEGSTVPERLGQFHAHASAVFQGAIGEMLHTAMGPEPL